MHSSPYHPYLHRLSADRSVVQHFLCLCVPPVCLFVGSLVLPGCECAADWYQCYGWSGFRAALVAQQEVVLNLII